MIPFTRLLCALMLALLLGNGPAGPPGFAAAHSHDHAPRPGEVPDNEGHPDCSLCLAVHHLALDLPTPMAVPVPARPAGVDSTVPPALHPAPEPRQQPNRGPPALS